MNTCINELNTSKPVQANDRSYIELTQEQLKAIFGGGNCIGAHVYEDTGYTQPLDGSK